MSKRAVSSIVVVGAFVAASAYLYVAPSRAADAPAGGGAWAVVKTFHVGGEGRWDYLTVDPAAKLLYVPRSTHTQIIRADTGEVVGDLKDTAGVHGVAIVPELGRGFTSNGRGNNVTVFDLKTMQPLGNVPTGLNPDAIIYDPASKRVIAFNGRSNDATVIVPDGDPAAKETVSATIPLGGKPESAASDGAGHVYVNLEDKSSIAAIDTKTMKVIATWKIEGGRRAVRPGAGRGPSSAVQRVRRESGHGRSGRGNRQDAGDAADRKERGLLHVRPRHRRSLRELRRRHADGGEGDGGREVRAGPGRPYAAGRARWGSIRRPTRSTCRRRSSRNLRAAAEAAVGGRRRCRTAS
jgi:hypothetical protein